MAPQILEGTWEDLVSRHNGDLAGHKVRLQVLDEAQNAPYALSLDESELLLNELAAGLEHLPILPSDTFGRTEIYEGRD